MDQLLQKQEQEGRALLVAPPIIYKKTGKRLLSVSREAVKRILLWSFDYRLTGEEKFRARAEQEMLAAAAFPDWNPSHFLDVGEMTAAMALGYDWLYDKLPPAARQIIRQAIVDKGLKAGLDPKAPHNYWYRAEMNWNQVCLGGLTLGALAVADEEPQLSRQILTQVREYNPHGMKPYAAGDGSYPEGPGYWAYGTTYQVILLAALESALGTDWNLSSSPGFLDTAYYPMETTGPTGLAFNYSDGSAHVGLEPALYWFARHLKDPSILQFQHHELAAYLADQRPLKPDTSDQRFMPLLAIWSGDLETPPKPTEALAWHEDGRNPLAVFRSSWTDPNALFVGVKGGSAAVNHGHMDAGSFVMEADGVRWGEDLGSQDYESLESKGVDLWNQTQNSQRWQVFRLNNFSHSTLTINGQLHQVKGYASIIRFVGNGETPHAVIDLTSVFAGQAAKVVRGFKLLPGRRVLVQDELSGLKSGDNVRWAFVTPAIVTVQG
ncbi:MAG TPA: heparinase II/III family protein, partial [Rhizomicrobium sp.]|nr:heparinase II/III family protein [Rhizomicrobium sp.]